MLRLWFISGWLICNVCLHAEFVDLQAESKPVTYSNFVDCVRSCINEEFYHANLFARKAQDDWNVGSNGQFSGKSFADTASSSAKGKGKASSSTPQNTSVPSSSGVTASDSASSQVSKEAQGLLGQTDKRYKPQFFERAGKAKDQTSLNAAKIELQGGQIDLAAERGVTWDHVTKVQEAQDGLRQHIGKINARLSHPQCPMLDRKALTEELSKASKLLDHTEQFVPRA